MKFIKLTLYDRILLKRSANFAMPKTRIRQFFHNISKDKTWLTFSNGFTLIRFILIPFIMYYIAQGEWEFVGKLFIVALLTDFIDGKLARAFNQVTIFGAFFDSITDKILVAATFLTIIFVNSPSYTIPSWFAWIILIREVVIVGGTLIVIHANPKFSPCPTIWGKLATVTQEIFIFGLFLFHFLGWNPNPTYSVLTIILPIFWTITLIQYVFIGIRCMKAK